MALCLPDCWKMPPRVTSLAASGRQLFAINWPISSYTEASNCETTIKKPSLNSNSLSSYRLVSQLPFPSEVLERVVLTQMRNYLAGNDFYDRYQSAYREYHSTEILLLYVHDDLLGSLDVSNCVALLLFDFILRF